MITFDYKEHGAVPFWFWNGDQQETEITRQLELAAEGGLKGMAIHARVGNQTDYMSPRWIELIRHACEEALRLGLDIWLYDEEGFPSGTVGHRLQKDEPFYQQKYLRFGYCVTRDVVDKIVVAAYDAITYERLDIMSLPPEQEILAFSINYLPGYIDALKRETSDRFLEMTHLRYFDELGDYFGKPITHVYTDDLNSNLDRESSLPFTEHLFETFADRLGYDLRDHLPKLVENLPGHEKVRLEFRKLVMDLFLSEFVSPMHQWCDEHGLMFTGHLSGDEGPIDKSIHSFGAAMPFYEHEHIPGIDDFLCSMPNGRYLDQLRNHREHSITVLLKQATSVANQLKNGFCGGEVLTFLGWGAPVWGQAALLNYELAMGINVFTHHDFSYATGGVTKRDCPPSYFFQQPYWPQYRKLLDGLARSCQLLKRGVHAADVLVIHPMSSCWIAMDGKQITQREAFEARTENPHLEPRALEDSLTAVSHELLKLRIGFDYGDEWLMAKHAKVEGGVLLVGDMTYSSVIIPQVTNLLGSTVELLKALETSGGNILAVQPPNDCLVDGEMPAHPVFGYTLNPTVVSRPEGLSCTSLKLDFHLTTDSDEPIISHTRKVGGALEHFVCNVSDKPQTVQWMDDLIAYDPVENQCVAVDDRSLTLPPFHAIHLLHDVPVGAGRISVASSVFAFAQTHGFSVPETAWEITLDQPNLLLIDWCDLLDGSQAHHTDRKIPEDILEVTVAITLPDPSVITSVMGEAATLESIRINGNPLPKEHVQHPSSQDMLITDATGLFKTGKNVIQIPRHSTLDTPHIGAPVLFEPFYLMGDFGVTLINTDHGMRPQIAELKPGMGDLVEQGLPFFWGGVRYETDLTVDSDMTWLDCGEVDGVLSLNVNGNDVGCRLMPPYRFYIADHLIKGMNTITLTLYNTAQNLYGPHRRDLGVALEPCTQRGEEDGAYFLAGFGINGPVMAN